MVKKNTVIRKWRHALLALGISVCLIGALLMAAGEGIFGENHSGVAAVVGIVGIGIIGTSNTTLVSRKAERKEK